MNMFLSIIGVALVWSSVHTSGSGLAIEENPSALLIPVNRSATFSCKSDCSHCSGRWYINGSNTLRNDGHYYPQYSHFEFSDKEDGTLLVTVNASVAVNNTKFYCIFQGSGDTIESVQSETATLLVISSSPLPVNPSLEMNSTHATIIWSPPFLWPGQAIQQYNISYSSRINNESVNESYYLMNNTFNTSIVSYTRQLLTCTEVTFDILAISSSSSAALNSFSVSSCVHTTTVDFARSAINTRILFEADGTPAVVEARVQLPSSICSCQELNYTLLVYDEGGKDILVELGPIQRIGPGVVKQYLMSNSFLEGSRNYSLKVQVQMYSQVFTSYEHFFNTSFKDCFRTEPPFLPTEATFQTVSKQGSADIYMAVMITAIIVAGVMLAIISVTVCIFLCQKQWMTEKKCSDSKKRVCNAMVPNPIYGRDEEESGPVYDSIRPQYEILVSVSPPAANSDSNDSDNKVDLSTVRYVDQPTLPPHIRSQSFTNTVPDVSDTTPPRAYSVSIPANMPRAMSLKKNGQERNKLGLTLTLGGTDTNVSDGVASESSRNSVSLTEAGSGEVEESYMVMNPVSTN